jgi:DNA polymerase
MSKPIVLVGEAKGEQEAKINSSFVGASGIELLRMLDEAGIISLTGADYDSIATYYRKGDPHSIDRIWRSHPEVYRTNVFQQHPPANRIESFCGPKAQALIGYPLLIKGKYVREEFRPELDRLAEELVEIDPNLIVALGNTPLWALTGQTAISKRRGTTCLSSHTAASFKLLPTYHPAAVLRQWELRPISVIDLVKAKRESEYPEIRRPPREVWIEPTLQDLETFYEQHIVGCKILSVDIETSGSQVTCIGFATGPGLAIVLPFYDSRRKARSYWHTLDDERKAWVYVKRVLELPCRKLFQNGLYDIAFLWRSNGIKVMGATHDTMLLHHALQPESLKGLGFLGSIYTDEGNWKDQRKKVTTIKADE